MRHKKKRLCLFLMGPTGVGKTTTCNYLVSEHNFLMISGGQVLRKMLIEDSAMKSKDWVKSCLNEGGEIPRKYLIPAINLALMNESSRPVIFDNYIQTVDQVESLHSFLNDAGMPDVEIQGLQLHANKSFCLDRVKNRRICSGCGWSEFSFTVCVKCGGKPVNRIDDTPKIAGQKYDRYTNELKRVYQYFEKKFPSKSVVINHSIELRLLANELPNGIIEKQNTHNSQPLDHLRESEV